MATVSTKNFSREAREIIKRLEDQGWTFRVSSNGHAIGKSPEGSHSISVAPRLSARNRAYQNTLAEVRRWEKASAEATQAAEGLIQERGPEVQALGTVLEALVSGVEYDPVLDGVLANAAGKHSERAIERLAAQPATSPPREIVGDVSQSSSTVEEDRDMVSRTTTNTRSHDGAKARVRKANKPAPLLDSGMRERAESERTVLEALSNVDDTRRPATQALLDNVWLGEPGMESRGGLPAGARPAWSSDGELCGWLWPVSAGVGVRRRGRPATGIRQGEAVLPGPFPLPGDVPVVSPEGGLGQTKVGDPEVRVREPLTDTEIVAKVRLLVGGRDVELEGKYERALEFSRAQAGVIERLEADLANRKDEVARLGGDLDAWLSLAPRPEE